MSLSAQLAGNYARLPISTLNNFAAVYLLSRAAYNVLYITGEFRAVHLVPLMAQVRGCRGPCHGWSAVSRA